MNNFNKAIGFVGLLFLCLLFTACPDNTDPEPGPNPLPPVNNGGDSYDKDPLPTSFKVTTENCVVGITEATLKGSVSGVNNSVTAGVIYNISNNLDEYHGYKVDTYTNGDFEVRLSELTESETYYYRAYAIIDNKYYYGDIKSFTTEAFTYSIDGRVYKMIRVEDGPNGTFYMMQTELPPNKDLLIDMDNYGRFDRNKNGCFVKTECHTFINLLRKGTGLNWRLPTKEEWKYAASGGSKSAKYKFSGSNTIGDVAWYNDNSQNSAHGLALKKANELGLYDMSGNYAELTFDETGSDEFDVDGDMYGGSWQDPASECTVTSYKKGSRNGKISGTDTNESLAVLCDNLALRLIYYR